eukprot:357500-Chlamydomonas_euryale.AAC.3
MVARLEDPAADSTEASWCTGPLCESCVLVRQQNLRMPDHVHVKQWVPTANAAIPSCHAVDFIAVRGAGSGADLHARAPHMVCRDDAGMRLAFSMESIIMFSTCCHATEQSLGLQPANVDKAGMGEAGPSPAPTSQTIVSNMKIFIKAIQESRRQGRGGGRACASETHDAAAVPADSALALSRFLLAVSYPACPWPRRSHAAPAQAFSASLDLHLSCGKHAHIPPAARPAECVPAAKQHARALHMRSGTPQ